MTDFRPRPTLHQLVSQNLPIYVKNLTRPRGQVVLTITLNNGKNTPLKIPKTFIPINLSDHAPVDVLANCYDLSQYILKGILELQWPDEAAAELGGGDSQDEIRRLQLSEFSSLSKFTSKRVQDAERTEAQTKQLTASSKFDVSDTEVQTISPRVMQLIQFYKADDKTAKEILSELRIIETELTNADCSYVVSNGPAGQVREFCQRVLAKLQPAAASVPSTAMPTSVPDEYDITKDDEDMTEEDRALEEARALQAQAQADDSSARNYAVEKLEKRMRRK